MTGTPCRARRRGPSSRGRTMDSGTAARSGRRAAGAAPRASWRRRRRRRRTARAPTAPSARARSRPTGSAAARATVSRRRASRRRARAGSRGSARGRKVKRTRRPAAARGRCRRWGRTPRRTARRWSEFASTWAEARATLRRQAVKRAELPTTTLRRQAVNNLGASLQFGVSNCAMDFLPTTSQRAACSRAASAATAAARHGRRAVDGSPSGLHHRPSRASRSSVGRAD